LPRRSRPLDPSAGPLAQFALELRGLRDHAPAGRLTSIDRVADQPGQTTSKASIYAALAGQRLPSRETLTAMVQAWAPSGPRDLSQWMARRRFYEEKLHHLEPTEESDDDRRPMTASERGPAAVALADWLTALREREGVTVRQLAKRTDMPASTVAAYLSGQSIPLAKDRLESLLHGLNANHEESDYAEACWADYRIGMDPREPPEISGRAR